MKRKLNTAIVLIFIGSLLYMFARADYRQGEPSLRGQPEKDFALTLDGKPARLSDFRGRVVVLNFWATWCPPCVEETPSLNALQRRIAPLGGTVLGDQPGRRQGRLREFPEILPTRISELSRSLEENRARLRHHHVSGNLHHRPQGPPRPQNHRRAGLDRPRTHHLSRLRSESQVNRCFATFAGPSIAVPVAFHHGALAGQLPRESFAATRATNAVNRR